MKKKNLEYIIRKLSDDIDSSANHVSKGFSADAIHDFRLLVKELRALLRMLSMDPGCCKKIRIPRKIKCIYYITGKLRDLHVFREMIKYYFSGGQLPKHYIKLLEYKHSKYTKKLKRAIHNKPIKISAKKIEDKLPVVLQPDIASSFYNKKIETIKETLYCNSISDEQIHGMRKSIKDILYIKKLATANADYDEYFGKYKTFTEGEQLACELGQINDLCTALDFLEPSRLDKITTQEITQLASLRQQCYNNKELLKASVLKKLIELYL